MTIAATILTFILGSFFAIAPVLADIINQESFKTHLRWNLKVPRDQFVIVKKGETLFIETLNLQLFESLSKDFGRLSANPQYIDTVSYSKENFPTRPATIAVKLKNPTVELFSFYRDADQKYILDFWINADLLSESTGAPVAFKKPLPLPEINSQRKKKKKLKKTAKKDPGFDIPRTSILPVVAIAPNDLALSDINPGFRDFRYGGSFIWNYGPMIPQLEKDINLASKIPDALYPIKDRLNLDDPKEAHMQLSINFFKEEKWGLMNKSIGLYVKKYGRDSNFVVNEYMKANALLKGNLAKPNRGITQSAMIMLGNIKDLTNDYDMKAGILRYLIQYHVDMKDHVKALELSKQLYVVSRENFDQTMIIQSALTILHSLAELKQAEKIESFLTENKKVNSILPTQMAMAYQSFALLSRGEDKEVLRRFESVEKSLTKPIHPAILYNVGESYFRQANFEKSISLFDEFVNSYSYVLLAPQARLRMALAYEILDRPAAETLVLYRNAIDRSTNPESRYEAKLRYVGLLLARKIKPTKEERETEVFLEQSPDETKALTLNLKKLLWLVRLRLFITSGDFDKAIAYLTTIPLDGMKPADRKVFEGDGAEIVFGLIKDAYLKEDYAKAVKIWEVYKDKFEKSVAKNIYMNFVVCDSYLKLGLFKSYDRALATFKSVQGVEARTYPLWVERTKTVNLPDLVEELSLMRLVADKNWPQASDKLASLPVSVRDSINYPYYQGLISFHQDKYHDAILEFEKVLVKQNPVNQLTPRQTAELLMGYVESLYRLKDQERFKTVVKALSSDINKSKSAPILNISERINYLLIESYAGESNPNWKEIENMTKAYRQKFQKSPYTARIGYLYGLSLIKNSRVAEGKEVLNLLTTDTSVPSHIKEMCRSELTTLELTEKKL